MEGSEEPVPDEAASPEPRPALTESDLRPDRQIPFSGEVIGLVVVVALGILMVGFILGRVTAPDEDEAASDSSAPVPADTFSFPAGDVDRSGYWRFASITPAVVDTFDRPDDATSLGEADDGQRWQAITGTWGIDGNRAAAQPDRRAPRIAVIRGGSVDQLVEATMIDVEEGAGLVFRFRDPENFWAVTADPDRGAWRVIRVLDGSPNAVGSVQAGTADGTTISVSLRPARVIVLVEGVVKGQYDDEALGSETDSGLIALSDAGPAARWDRFFLGNLPPG